MRSKTAEKIFSETSEETKEKVRQKTNEKVIQKTNKMKQTAVEWLATQLGIEHRKTLINQAKQIEKQQIIDARQDGYESTYNSCESGCMGREILEGSNEQYYNETFNK